VSQLPAAHDTSHEHAFEQWISPHAFVASQAIVQCELLSHVTVSHAPFASHWIVHVHPEGHVTPPHWWLSLHSTWHV
jgi:hypothetical protein